MEKHNLPYNNKARQIKAPDFKKYDYIFGMDEENIDDLKGICPKDGTAKILLLGDFDPQGDRIIRDPYYVRTHRFFNAFFVIFTHKIFRLKQDRGSEGFEKCYQQAVRCSKGFLAQLKQNRV